MSDWIKVSDRIPQISYLESDNADDPYGCFPVLVFVPEKPGIMCVAHIEQNQDENSWNFGEYHWQVYVPGEPGDICGMDFEVVTHWMALPKAPEKNER